VLFALLSAREGAALRELTCLEICAGAGGQSLGLEQAGFVHSAVVEIDLDACETLQLNRPEWNVVRKDIHHFRGAEHHYVDLLAGGVPCPPFSIAGKQIGADDERDLFPQALHLIEECDPTSVMLENVPGLSTIRFARYRQQILDRLSGLGYETDWQVLNACEFGVPQLRPRFILVAMKPDAYRHFEWPPAIKTPPTAGPVLTPGPRKPTASDRRWLAVHASMAVLISGRLAPGRPGSSWASTARDWQTRRPDRPTPSITCRD
jgi:DNA (cytosine-5)-methyltransferase 1